MRSYLSSISLLDRVCKIGFVLSHVFEFHNTAPLLRDFDSLSGDPPLVEPVFPIGGDIAEGLFESGESHEFSRQWGTPIGWHFAPVW